MNTDGLVAAYDDLLSALRTLDPTGLHHDQRDEIDWLVAHLVLSDAILVAAADHVLEGAGTVTVDNRRAMDRDAIANVLSSLSHHERIQTIEDHRDELVDRHRCIPKAAAGTVVRLVLYDRTGRLSHQSTTTWSELVAARADQHLPGHARTLRTLVQPRT
ncbi:MAG: hypothetical protein M0Z42_16180 [Actinomycetota bacterium]|nr:hypothetical protein [Actinomycetota bacterium]